MSMTTGRVSTTPIFLCLKYDVLVCISLSVLMLSYTYVFSDACARCSVNFGDESSVFTKGYSSGSAAGMGVSLV